MTGEHYIFPVLSKSTFSSKFLRREEGKGFVSLSHLKLGDKLNLEFHSKEGGKNMRNERISLFDRHLKNELQSLVVELNARIERTLLGPITPNEETYFNVKKFRRPRELQFLAIASYYLESGFGELLREDLRDINFGTLREQETLRVLCSSKETMLEYLSMNHERRFFGYLLPSVRRTFARLNFLTLKPQHARRKVRRRGYRDHGSCKPQSRWLPTSDYEFNLLMNKIELEENFKSQVFLSIDSKGLLGVRLPFLERETGPSNSTSKKKRKEKK